MWISNLKLTFSIEGLKVICVDRWDCWNPAKILHSFEYCQIIGTHSKLPWLCNIGTCIGKSVGFLIMFKILCKFWKGKCVRGRNYKSCLSCECLLLRSLHPFEGKERGLSIHSECSWEWCNILQEMPEMMMTWENYEHRCITWFFLMIWVLKNKLAIR